MKKYKVADLQIGERYFWEGHIFDDKAEIVEGLLDYHSIDFEGTDDKENELDIYEYIKFYKYNTIKKQLDWVLDYGQWELEEVKDEECFYCSYYKEYFENYQNCNCDMGRTI
jgi:hypothetical protein